MIRAARPSERGIALVLALLMSLMIMALAASVLYVVAQSTRLSGATKRFATAAEAADGAVQAAKETGPAADCPNLQVFQDRHLAENLAPFRHLRHAELNDLLRRHPIDAPPVDLDAPVR